MGRVVLIPELSGVDIRSVYHVSQLISAAQASSHAQYAATDHNNRHKYEVIERLVLKTKQELGDKVATLEDMLSRQQKAIVETRQVLEIVESNKEKCLQESRDAEEKQTNDIKGQYEVIRQQIVDNNEELQAKFNDFLSTLEEEQETLTQRKSALSSCLSEDDGVTLLTRSESLVQEAATLRNTPSHQMENFSVATLLVNEHQAETSVSISDVTVQDLVRDLNLSSLHIKSHWTAPSAPDMPLALPPPMPGSLTLVHTLPIYKSGSKEPLQEKFSIADGIYSLSNKWIYRYLAPFESAGKIGAHADDGTSIHAYRRIIYTRQMKASELLHVYKLYDTGSGFLIQPKEIKHAFHWEKTLIESFAIVGDFFVFCSDSITPKLIIFNINTEDRPRKISIQCTPYCHQPIYVCAGPSGHVLLLGTEWVEMNNRAEVLRLVNIQDGSTVWRVLWNGSCSLQRTPNPVTYHNGYIYAFPRDVSHLKVIDGLTGSTLKTMSIPVTTEDSWSVTINSVQLCLYTDEELVLSLTHQTRSTPSRGGPSKTDNGLMLTRWRIEFEDRRF